MHHPQSYYLSLKIRGGTGNAYFIHMPETRLHEPQSEPGVLKIATFCPESGVQIKLQMCDRLQ